MRTSIVPAGDAFDSGEVITVEASITNCGSSVLVIGSKFECSEVFWLPVVVDLPEGGARYLEPEGAATTRPDFCVPEQQFGPLEIPAGESFRLHRAWNQTVLDRDGNEQARESAGSYLLRFLPPDMPEAATRITIRPPAAGSAK